MKYTVIKNNIFGENDLPETLLVDDNSIFLYNSFLPEEFATTIEISNKDKKNIVVLDAQKYFSETIAFEFPETLEKKDFLLKPLGERNDWFRVYVLSELRKIPVDTTSAYVSLKEKFLKDIQQFDSKTLADDSQKIQVSEVNEIIQNSIKIIEGERQYLSERQVMTKAKKQRKESKQDLFQVIEEHFIKDFPDYVLYIQGERESNEEIYIYQEGYYQYVSQQNIEAKIGIYLKERGLFQYNKSATYTDIFKRIKSHLRALNHRCFYDKDISKTLINLQNGLFDLRTKKLSPHNKLYFHLTQLPFEYNPTATAPEFKKFIDTVTLKDEQLIRMLQQMYGYVLMPGNPKHKMHILHGLTTRNGKSTTCKILSYLIGERNTSYIDLNGLSGKNQFDLVNIENKILNISDETGKSFIESPVLTSMIGEGTIEINRKFVPSYTHKVTTNFISSGNYTPRFSDGAGMGSRVIIIPFENHLSEEDRIENLDIIIADKELSGIFNWALIGADDVEKNGFYYSDKSLKEKDSYDRDNNSIQAFLSDWCVVGIKDEFFISSNDLYGSKEYKNKTGYNAYCEEYGVKAVGRRMFFNEILRIRKSYEGFSMVERGNKRIDGKVTAGYFNIKLDDEHTEKITHMDTTDTADTDFKF